MRDIAIYTGLRLALLAAVWLLLQAVTPFRGLMAVVIALLISGVISVVLLDRPRDRAGNKVAGVFRRIDERIEKSRTAEDFDDESPLSGQPDTEPEQRSVGEGQQPGHLQDGDEGTPTNPA
ncbi:MAG: DUF4229 domain-containing protein [Candidatus Nanopelagicales bacterium]